MGPVCNSKSEVSGDQVALLNGSCPISMVFDLVEAESLGSPQTIPSGTYGSLFWTLCLTVLFVGLVYSIFVSLLMTDLNGQTMGHFLFFQMVLFQCGLAPGIFTPQSDFS